MQVKELMALLKGLPQDTEVWMASDAEGNSFHHVEDVESGGGDNMALIIWPSHEDIDVG